MPTWILGAVLYVIGPHSWLTNALAAVCFAVTGWLTWLIARHLFDEKVANTAIILWTLQQSFSVSAQIYNHNTVLVMFMAATVYALLLAQSQKNNYLYWFLAGLFAGCAMLSKYQAVLTLFVLAVVVLTTNKLPLGQVLRQFSIASVGFFLVFTPHFYWALANNFPTLRYASGALESGGIVQRAGWIASFFVNQLRMLFPLVLALGIVWVTHKISGALTGEEAPLVGKTNFPTSSRIWVWGLLWIPIAILIASSLVTGSQLRNHWGVQFFQFLSIWITLQIRHKESFRLTLLIPVALAVHLIGFSYYAIKQSDPTAVQSDRRADSAYPAIEMSKAALAFWNTHTACPLKIVGGDFEAGLVSAFTNTFPAVSSGSHATPWVTPKQIEDSGILYVLEMGVALPPDTTAAKNWVFSSGNAKDGEIGKHVQLAVRLPLSPCNPRSGA